MHYNLIFLGPKIQDVRKSYISIQADDRMMGRRLVRATVCLTAGHTRNAQLT